MHFNLAPLRMRRDIAMLGMVHRAALGKGPPHLRELIKRAAGGFRVQDPYDNCRQPQIVRRSAWGLLRIYNRLGTAAQSIKDVPSFQQYLQNWVKRRIVAGTQDDWATTYCPR